MARGRGNVLFSSTRVTKYFHGRDQAGERILKVSAGVPGSDLQLPGVSNTCVSAARTGRWSKRSRGLERVHARPPFT